MTFQLHRVPSGSCLFSFARFIIFRAGCLERDSQLRLSIYPGVKKMKGSSKNLQVSAAVLSLLLFVLLVSPIQSRKIAEDDVQPGGNETVVVTTLDRRLGRSPPAPQANANSPDRPALQTSKH